MKHYSYKGPVMEFDKIIANHWEASTWAVSADKARCNLSYRFKTENGRTPNAKITLPGKIVVIE